MTVEEIFNKIGSHMEEGISYHQDMIKAYEFLGLWGYSKCQEYHYFEEIHGYRKLQHYYHTHYFKIMQIKIEDRREFISQTWYKYSAQSVDVGTKRTAIKELMEKWIKWEKDTKKLYEEMYIELTNLREVAAAIEIQKYISDVDEELSDAQKELLNLEAIGYDLELIVDWQEKLRKKYK